MELHNRGDFTPTGEEFSNGESEQLIHANPIRSSKKCVFKGLSQRTSAFVVRAGLVTSLGGLMFGYDLGNVAGVLPLFEKEMNFGHDMSDSFVAMMPLGALSGTAIGGWMCDAVGRKKTILITSIIFIVGGLTQSTASSFGMLCAGRFIMGVGAATSAIADVSYLNEVAPTNIRGALISCNEFMAATGFLLSYLVAAGLNRYQASWRWLFGLVSVIALLQCLLMLNMPESLRWLYNKGKHAELRHAVLLVHEITDVQNQLDLLKAEEVSSGQTTSALTTTGKFKSRFLVCTITALLMIFQQLTCNSNVLSFGSKIFPDNVHAKNNNFTISIGVVKVFFTGVALFLVDKVGRKSMLCVGISIMCYSLINLSIGVSFMEFPIGNFLAYSATYTLVASYSISYGPVSWLVVSEMFPCSVRGRALACAQSLNWLMNACINSIFLRSLDQFGYVSVYGAYAFFTLLGLIFVVMLVPETVGKCPDEIQNELQHQTVCQCECFLNSNSDAARDINEKYLTAKGINTQISAYGN